MKIRYLIYLFFIVYIYTSCGNAYKIETKDLITISDYDVYIFRLCENINAVGTDRFFLCDTICEVNDVSNDKTIQVREELYLLKSKNSKAVIYLTTKTDRSFDKTPDIYNTEAHKNFVFANDLENIYFGEQAGNQLLFKNKNEVLSIDFDYDALDCSYIITKLLSKTEEENPISNRSIDLGEIYKIKILFNKSKRILAIRNKKRLIDTLQTIRLSGKKAIFKGKRDSVFGSQKRRLKYHPNFESI